MRKGWFRIPGIQDGDRTVEEQMKGLGSLQAGVRGARVLDLGCAEGLVLRRLLEAGASFGFGVDIVQAHIEEALRQCRGLNARFFIHDLNDTSWLRAAGQFDVVLMLAILHKLRSPLSVIKTVVETASPRVIVLRTPCATPGFVLDSRSGLVHHDIRGALGRCGYRLTEICSGHFDEWTGYFDRD